MKKMNKEFLVSILYSLVAPGILYFIVKLFQSNFHTIESVIDNKIPFIPYFIYFYILFFPFVVFILYVIFRNDKKVYYQCINANTLGLTITIILFLIYPTIIYRPVVSDNLDLLTKFLVRTTYFIDTPAINCFPSIHALLCFQVAYAILLCRHVNFKYKVITLAVVFLIILSTVFVKQHYLYDLIAAFLVFGFSNIVVYLKNSKLTKN